MRKVYTTGQIAKICSVAARTVTKWFDSGRLKGYRIPGSQDRRIPADMLIEFLRTHQIPIPPDLARGDKVLVLAVGMICSPTSNPYIHEQMGKDIDLHIVGTLFEAGTTFFQDKPNVVIIDFSMGRSEAIVLAKQIHKEGRRFGIIGLVNEDESDMRGLETSPWFDEILQSPVSGLNLRDSVINVLEQYHDSIRYRAKD